MFRRHRVRGLPLKMLHLVLNQPLYKEETMEEVLKIIGTRDPDEKEFHQAVNEVVGSIKPVLERNSGICAMPRF